MLLTRDLFVNNPGQFYWKVVFTAKAQTSSNGIASGQSGVVLKLNQLPTNGNCSVWPNSGSVITTKFNMSCNNWLDNDGKIVSYAFFGKRPL
jgi:hypothetical protein